MNEERTVHIEYDPPDERWPGDDDGWTVSLPHQCEEWCITERYGYVTHGEAVVALHRFVSEAEKALRFLEGQEAKPEERVKWPKEER